MNGPGPLGVECRAVRRLSFVLAWLAVLAYAALCARPGEAAGQEAPLHVVTSPIAPFVLPDTDPPAGFSVDLWSEVARRMGVEFEWGVVSGPELLALVERGEADVAIAAIAMTAEGEAQVDFSHPYLDSGLQILVRSGSEGALLDTLRSAPWRTIAELFAAWILVIFVLANVLWLLERPANRDFAKPYLRALGEGMWATMLIIATGEHGERSAPGVLRRIAVAGMWLVGVVLVAHLTATVTSSQTALRLRSSIRGPEDLPRVSIASVPGTVAADYLQERGLPFVPVQTNRDGVRLLLAGQVQAVVSNAPTLHYWAAQEGHHALEIVGPVFRPEKFGIAVAEGSPLRKRINQALLEMYRDGTYERIHASWFSRGAQP